MIPVNPSPLRLEDYATFQYMLAPPSIASPIVKDIQSFVFYDEPHNPQKKEEDHKVMLQGTINLASYYGCCLALLPSHLMGMSEWISFEDLVPTKDEKTKKKKGDSTCKILRRFRYSYYWGMLQVDTRHVQLKQEEEDSGTATSFRLVEYMNISLGAWFIAEAFYMGVVVLAIWLYQTTMMVNVQSSSVWITFATTVVAFNALFFVFRGQFRG